MSNIKCVGNSVDTNEVFLHPITLELVLNKSSNKICPTELHYADGKPYTYAPIGKTTYKKEFKDRDLQQFMSVPYLNLSMEQMLMMYKITSIDTMMKWIDNNMDKPLQTINRILMVWIRFNFEDLKDNNRILINIYKKLSKHFKLKSINEDDLESKINKWFKNNSVDSFHLDLTEFLFFE
jgi:hypothetical protein